MQKEEVDSLEVFLNKLCYSFSSSIHTSEAKHVEFYGAPSWVLGVVQERTYSYFFQGPAFSFRETSLFPEIKKGWHYLNVGYFLERHELKKSEGENVKF